MVIDAIALIVTLEQASAHQFRHRPAHIRLARSPYLLTDGVFDHSRGLTLIHRQRAGHCQIAAYPLFQGYATGVALPRSEEHTSELQSLMRISYAVFCLKKKTV